MLLPRLRTVWVNSASRLGAIFIVGVTATVITSCSAGVTPLNLMHQMLSAGEPCSSVIRKLSRHISQPPPRSQSVGLKLSDTT